MLHVDVSEILYPIVKEYIIDKVDNYDEFKELCLEQDIEFNKKQDDFIMQCFIKDEEV